jgi:hypothetical protein
MYGDRDTLVGVRPAGFVLIPPQRNRQRRIELSRRIGHESLLV